MCKQRERCGSQGAQAMSSEGSARNSMRHGASPTFFLFDSGCRGRLRRSASRGCDSCWAATSRARTAMRTDCPSPRASCLTARPLRMDAAHASGGGRKQLVSQHGEPRFLLAGKPAAPAGALDVGLDAAGVNADCANARAFEFTPKAFGEDLARRTWRCCTRFAPENRPARRRSGY